MRKTFIASHLTSYLRQQGHTLTPVDFDVLEGLIARVFKDEVMSISPDLDLLRRGESWMPHLIEQAISGRSFVVDTGANTGGSWPVFINELWPSCLAELEKAGVALTIICPVSRDEKSKSVIKGYAQVFPTAEIIMAVCRDSMHDDFPLPDHPATHTIDVPCCVPKLFHTYNDRCMLVDDIAKSTDKDLIVTRSFARAYLSVLHPQFDRILPIITRTK